MSLFVISDLHLSLGTNKPMDKFDGWKNYVSRLSECWARVVNEDDTVVIPGDVSWAMNLKEAVPDFRFIHNLKGTKIISKGNHDYWWDTVSKLNRFLEENGFDSIKILHNNHYPYEGYGICGTRGWVNDSSEPFDAKIISREKQRLETSICSAENAGLEPLVFLHYPPVHGRETNDAILEVMEKHHIKRCFYGHLHGKHFKYALQGNRNGIEYKLISSDYMQFCPMKII